MSYKEKLNKIKPIENKIIDIYTIDDTAVILCKSNAIKNYLYIILSAMSNLERYLKSVLQQNTSPMVKQYAKEQYVETLIEKGKVQIDMSLVDLTMYANDILNTLELLNKEYKYLYVEKYTPNFKYEGELLCR